MRELKEGIKGIPEYSKDLAAELYYFKGLVFSSFKENYPHLESHYSNSKDFVLD